MQKRLFFCAMACTALFPSCGFAAWESGRASAVPMAVVRASTGAFEVSYVVGEDCASPGMLSASGFSMWSGLLSAASQSSGMQGVVSTSAVNADGGLFGMTPGSEISMVFGDEISADMSSHGVSVVRLYDNSGSAVNAAWPVAVTYSGSKLVVAPSASWPKGSVFAVSFSSSIVDVSGAPMTEASTFYFSVIMDHTQDNTAMAFHAPAARVRVPANAYGSDYFLVLSTDSARAEIAQANSKLGSMPGAPEPLSFLKIDSYDQSGAAVQPGKACVVTLPYPDADGDGLVDGSLSKVRTSTLSVWRLDEARGLWVRQTGAALDASARTLSKQVSHFSDYAVMGLPDTDLSPVYPYPVPFRPNAGNSARYGNWSDLITFTNLPASGRIRIYSVSGDLVRELPAVPPSVKWDLKNSSGETVASGVYIWEVVAGENRKTGKLMVIK